MGESLSNKEPEKDPSVETRPTDPPEDSAGRIERRRVATVVAGAGALVLGLGVLVVSNSLPQHVANEEASRAEKSSEKPQNEKKSLGETPEKLDAAKEVMGPPAPSAEETQPAEEATPATEGNETDEEPDLPSDTPYGMVACTAGFTGRDAWLAKTEDSIYYAAFDGIHRSALDGGGDELIYRIDESNHVVTDVVARDGRVFCIDEEQDFVQEKNVTWHRSSAYRLVSVAPDGTDARVLWEDVPPESDSAQHWRSAPHLRSLGKWLVIYSEGSSYALLPDGSGMHALATDTGTILETASGAGGLHGQVNGRSDASATVFAIAEDGSVSSLVLPLRVPDGFPPDSDQDWTGEHALVVNDVVYGAYTPGRAVPFGTPVSDSTCHVVRYDSKRDRLKSVWTVPGGERLASIFRIGSQLYALTETDLSPLSPKFQHSHYGQVSRFAQIYAIDERSGEATPLVPAGSLASRTLSEWGYDPTLVVHSDGIAYIRLTRYDERDTGTGPVNDPREQKTFAVPLGTSGRECYEFETIRTTRTYMELASEI